MLLDKDDIKGAAAIAYVSWGMKLWGIGGIVGHIAFGYIADLIGRRLTILLYTLGTLVVGLYLFLGVSTYRPYPILLLIYGFFVVGIFSGHAIYMSELFPTHVRATAVAFCNGSGRVSPASDRWWPGCSLFSWRAFQCHGDHDQLRVLSIVAVLLGRETRDEQLPR